MKELKFKHDELVEEIKFEHNDLKKIFGEKTKYIKLNNIRLLTENTKVVVVSKLEGNLEEYNPITLKDYLKILDKYYNPNKEKYKNQTSIKTLKLSTMESNALSRAGISYISQLENLTEKELSIIQGIGDKSISHIKTKLSEIGKNLKD